ncbi:MAG: M23 family metallopeptidase [Myxococcales bacterium]|nr:M23 family metallopeptidase [Myxococcales bacterium]
MSRALSLARASRNNREPVGVLEAFGLRPLRPALAQAARALGGDPNMPATRFGLSSTRVFKPRIAIPTWLGLRPRDGRLWIYNLFNHDAPPPTERYSVRVTRCRDFQGGQFTYDAHRGVDIAAPVGTFVSTPAPGVVRSVVCDMDRGGLKVAIDHGSGLFTTLNHLSRALVRPGARVGRGDVVALSGSSGMELVLFFPWVAPHVHFNVLLDGQRVDPFAHAGLCSLWRSGDNQPLPHRGEPGETHGFVESDYDEQGVEAAIADCKDDDEACRLAAIPDLETRAAEVMMSYMFRGPLYSRAPRVYARAYERRAVLDLPFRAADVSGVILPEATR